jgi:hypothetical protein
MTRKLARPTVAYGNWPESCLSRCSRIVDISSAKRCYSRGNRLGAVVQDNPNYLIAIFAGTAPAGFLCQLFSCLNPIEMSTIDNVK